MESETIVADAALREKLRHSNGHTVKLCDESGEIIGYALTPEQARRLEVELAKVEISKEELDRRAASPDWYSTDDVMRLLEQS